MFMRTIGNILLLAIGAGVLSHFIEYSLLSHESAIPIILFSAIAAAWQQGEDIKKRKAKEKAKEAAQTTFEAEKMAAVMVTAMELAANKVAK